MRLHERGPLSAVNVSRHEWPSAVLAWRRSREASPGDALPGIKEVKEKGWVWPRVRVLSVVVRAHTVTELVTAMEWWRALNVPR